MENSLAGRLQLICSSLSPEEGSSTVDTLIKITQNVIDNPGVEQYRQLRLANKTFSQRVWRHPLAQEFMIAVGWVNVGDSLVLPSDEFLQEALIELTVVKSTLEQEVSRPVQNGVGEAGPSSSMAGPDNNTGGSRSTEYQERMKQLRELQRKEREEKKKIADQIKADRRETDQKEAKASHGRQLNFGSNLNRFEDIGVDLNSGGG